MHKILHGAIMGFIIGGLAVLLMWTMYISVADTVRNNGSTEWVMVAWVIGYTVLGAVLGALLPKHK